MKIKHLPSKFISKLLFCILFTSAIATTNAQLAWVKVPTPDTSASRNMLRGIAGTSSTDIWTVGSFQETPAGPPYYVQKDLITHWNGSNWQFYPGVNLSTSLDELWDVDAVSPTDVWAVGDYNGAATQAKLLHFNGSSWSNVSVPAVTGGSFFYSVEAISSNDVWAVGGKFASPTRLAYTLHYNGNSWSEVPVPSVGTYWNAFNKVNGLTTNDVWAAGYWGNNYGDFHSLIMHWNGSVWSNVSLPTSITSNSGEVLDIEMISANDVWAVGYYLTGGFYKIHWNGVNWTEVTPPNGGGGAFASLSSNNVFSFGGEISHWNGSAWTVVDSLTRLNYPSLLSTVHFINGETWAAGRQMDASGTNFFTLVYRSVNNTPTFVNGSTQSTSAAPGTPLSLNSPLRVQDNDVAQYVTYSIVTPPAHGTLNGLPATAVTNGGFAQPANASYTATAGYNGTDQFIIKVAVGSVSTLTTINVNVTPSLPVVLGGFTATKKEATVLLEWNTISESNALKFELDKSIDGWNFSPLATIAAKGNSNVVSKYVAIDRAPVEGTNYYRLRLVDKDGASTYYPQKTIRWQNKSASPIFTINNNASVSGALNITVLQPGKYALWIFNSNGDMVVQKTIAASAGNLSIALPVAMAAGSYIISLKVNEQSQAKLFIKK